MIERVRALHRGSHARRRDGDRRARHRQDAPAPRGDLAHRARTRRARASCSAAARRSRRATRSASWPTSRAASSGCQRARSSQERARPPPTRSRDGGAAHPGAGARARRAPHRQRALPDAGRRRAARATRSGSRSPTSRSAVAQQVAARDRRRGRASGRTRSRSRGSTTCSARAGGPRRCSCSLTARPTLWRDDPKRFAGRDHIRVELAPGAKDRPRHRPRDARRARRRARRARQLTEFIATQAAGSPLFAEELARLAAKGQDATSAPTIEAAIQVHLDALDDAARDAAARSSACSAWSAGTRGSPRSASPNAGDALRKLASAEILFEQATSRFKDTREWAFKHALMREVAYASLGEDALRDDARQGRATGSRRWARTTRRWRVTSSSAARARVAAGYLEKAARRALAANALGEAVSLAERALAFAEDKPTQFARAQLLDEAWARLDARAGERDDRGARDGGGGLRHARASVRARGARVRYEDACGGGPETSARLEQVRRDAQAAGLRRRGGPLRRGPRGAVRLRGRARSRPRRSQTTCSPSRRSTASRARRSTRGRRSPSCARRAARSARRSRRGGARRAPRATAGLKTREATLTINVGFALTTVGAKGEARLAIESGIALAQAIGSPGTVRHGQMNLLCWTATFGADAAHDALLAEPRATADAAIAGQLGAARPRHARRPLLPRASSSCAATRRARPSARARSSESPRRVTARRRCSTCVPVALGALGRGRAALRQAASGRASSRARPSR